LARHSNFFYRSVVFVFGLFLAFPLSSFALYLQLDTIVDVKTNFSSGCASIKDIGNQSERLGIDAVIFGDYARNSIEFGIKPFERIFKKTTNEPSVLENGASGFISEVIDNNRQIKNTLLIPGVETAPFYYWTGSNFDGNLIAHNWDKHLLVIGMHSASEYEQLPLPNSNFSLNYAEPLFNQFIFLIFLCMMSMGAVYKGYARIITVPLMVVFILLTINNHPFRSSPFDAYNGDQGVKPYQNLIDYVNSKGAMVFWNHMEKNSGVRQYGSVNLTTLPYPDDLLKTKNYTGFQVVGNNPIQQAEAGQQWDKVLMEYIQGQRDQPVWGYGSNDYFCEDQDGDKLGSVRTILLAHEKNNNALLDAMKKGRMYAVRQNDENRISLDEFIVEDQKTGQHATLGQELLSTDFPAVKIKLRSVKGGNKTAQIQIIRNGVIAKQETVSLPYELTWRDVGNSKEKKAYYRVKAWVNSTDHLISNPIFVNFTDSQQGEKVSSLTESNHSEPLPTIKMPTISEPSLTQNPLVETPNFQEVSDVKIADNNKGPSIAPSETFSLAEKPPVIPSPKSPISPSKLAAKASTENLKPTRGTKILLKIVVDQVALRKGPGTIFPKITNLKKGTEIKLIRRTNVEFKNKNWLVVKHGGRSGYIWEGMVEWVLSSNTANK